MTNSHNSDIKNFAMVDIMKYIMALAVVAIHNSVFTKEFHYAELFTWFINLAVPFFFIVSAFFMARKLDKCESANIKKTILLNRSKQLFRIFLVWLIIYLPWAVYYFTVVNPLPLRTSVYSYVTSIILLGETPYSWPLWFIYSMACVYMLMAFMTKYKYRQFILLIIFAVVYLSHFYIDSNLEAPFANIAHWCNYFFSRILGGGIYLLTGFVLYKVSPSIKIYGSPTAVVCGIFSVVFYFADLPFWQVFGGLALAVAALKINIPGGSIYLKLRNQSMWIYYFHMYVIMSIVVFFPELVSYNPWANILVVYGLSCLIAYLLYALGEKKNFRFINRLVR